MYVELLIAKLNIGERNTEQAIRSYQPDCSCGFLRDLSLLQIDALVIPNTVAALTCFALMKAYFEAVGDQDSLGTD